MLNPLVSTSTTPLDSVTETAVALQPKRRSESREKAQNGWLNTARWDKEILSQKQLSPIHEIITRRRNERESILRRSRNFRRKNLDTLGAGNFVREKERLVKLCHLLSRKSYPKKIMRDRWAKRH